MAYRADNKCERCECLVVPIDRIGSLIDAIICQNCWTDRDEFGVEYQIFTTTNFFNNKFRNWN